MLKLISIDAPVEESTTTLTEYKSIQTLRAISAMLVALMHLIFFYCDSIKYIGGSTPKMANFYFFKGFGGCGIQIFFVISGFIMAFLHAKGETLSFGDFAKRRITRIVPLYWIVTLFWAFVLVGSPGVPTLHLVNSLLFIPEFDQTPVVGPGWTLNLEMFFYALFGLSALVFRKSFLWIAVLFLVTNSVFYITGNYVMRLYSDPIVWNFIAGITIYHVHRSPMIQRESTEIFTIGVILLVSSIFWHLPDDSKGIRQFLPWGVPSMLIVLGAVSMESIGNGMRLFRINILLTMGDASYALYLIHGLCFFGVSNILLYTLKLQELTTPDIAIIVYLLVCCIIAIAVNKFIEKPSIRLTRKMFSSIHAILCATTRMLKYFIFSRI